MCKLKSKKEIMKKSKFMKGEQGNRNKEMGGGRGKEQEESQREKRINGEIKWKKWNEKEKRSREGTKSKTKQTNNKQTKNQPTNQPTNQTNNNNNNNDKNSKNEEKKEAKTEKTPVWKYKYSFRVHCIFKAF